MANSVKNKSPSNKVLNVIKKILNLESKYSKYQKIIIIYLTSLRRPASLEGRR